INGDCPNNPGIKPPCPGDNVILKWDDELLQAIRANPAATGPTVTARALGVLHTATYDAWAAYDPVAKVTRPDGPSQQAKASITLDNKTKAISYAAYRVLLDLFPARKADFDAQMAELLYDPDDLGDFNPANPSAASRVLLDLFPARKADFDAQMAELLYDPDDLGDFNPANPSAPVATAQGVGNKAAYAVITFRHSDGANQLGGYADTTGYQPVNTWDKVNDPWR